MSNDKCQHCGLIHGPLCPSVAAIEYFHDGTIKRVEYVTPADCVTPLSAITVPGSESCQIPFFNTFTNWHST